MAIRCLNGSSVLLIPKITNSSLLLCKDDQQFICNVLYRRVKTTFSSVRHHINAPKGHGISPAMYWKSGYYDYDHAKIYTVEPDTVELDTVEPDFIANI